MKVAIEGTPEEITALVLALQERQAWDIGVKNPMETIFQAVRQAIGGTAGASQDSSLT